MTARPRHHLAARLGSEGVHQTRGNDLISENANGPSGASQAAYFDGATPVAALDGASAATTSFTCEVATSTAPYQLRCSSCTAIRRKYSPFAGASTSWRHRTPSVNVCRRASIGWAMFATLLSVFNTAPSGE